MQAGGRAARLGGGVVIKYGDFFGAAPNGITGSGGPWHSSATAAAAPEVVSSSAAQSLSSTRAGGQDDMSYNKLPQKITKNIGNWPTPRIRVR